MARTAWCMLFLQAARLPFSLADASAGRSSAARMAMMATTTNSSISVNAVTGLSRLAEWEMPRMIRGVCSAITVAAQTLKNNENSFIHRPGNYDCCQSNLRHRTDDESSLDAGPG